MHTDPDPLLLLPRKSRPLAAAFASRRHSRFRTKAVMKLRASHTRASSNAGLDPCVARHLLIATRGCVLGRPAGAGRPNGASFTS